MRDSMTVDAAGPENLTGFRFFMGPLCVEIGRRLEPGWWQCKLLHGAREVWIPISWDHIRKQQLFLMAPLPQEDDRIIPILFRRQR